MSNTPSTERNCDHIIIEEDNMVDYDFHTVNISKNVNDRGSVLVRINDFERQEDQLFEKQLFEEYTNRFNGTINSFILNNIPYTGAGLNKVSTNPYDVVVKIKVFEEDVSEQFTGDEDFFYLEGKPLVKSSIYDFTSYVAPLDILIKINDSILNSNDIVSINSKISRIQLADKPDAGSIVKVTYCFRASVKSIDNERNVVLKEIPKLGQKVYASYFSQESNGWEIKNKQIIFNEPRITNRSYVNGEVCFVVKNYFYTRRVPLLPENQNYYENSSNTLTVKVFVDGTQEKVASINPSTGKIYLVNTPANTSTVTVNYYYQNEKVADKISVNYNVTLSNCSKCNGRGIITDYTINPVGDYSLAESENKLAQDLRNIIITNSGSDPVATWFGSNLNRLIGEKSRVRTSNGVVVSAITRINSEITIALENLRSTQLQQSTYQTVSDRELLAYIQNIQVIQDEVDPSFYKVSINIVNQAGNLVLLEQTINTIDTPPTAL